MKTGRQILNETRKEGSGPCGSGGKTVGVVGGGFKEKAELQG